VNELDRLQIEAAVVESNLNDLETDHSELVQAVRSLLNDYESARSEIIEAIRYSKTIPLFVFDKEKIRESLPATIMKVESIAATLANSETAKDKITAIVADRNRLELIHAAKEKRNAIKLEIARLKGRKRLEDLKLESATGPITKKIVEFSESSITDANDSAATRDCSISEVS